MGTSVQLLDAVKLDLATVTVPVVPKVSEKIEQRSEAGNGLIVIRRGGDGPLSDADPGDFTPRTGQATQGYRLDVYITTGYRDLLNFMDAIRNSLERMESNVKAAGPLGGGGEVIDVLVTEVAPEELADDRKQEASLLVEVRYAYTRGSL